LDQTLYEEFGKLWLLLEGTGRTPGEVNGIRSAAGISIANAGAEVSAAERVYNDGNASVRIAEVKGEDETAKGAVEDCLRTAC